MATIKEIAAKLKITPTAVSYALNGRADKISPATRERVLATAHEMGYQPHFAARALRTGRHQAVSVLIRTPQSPYYAEMLHHIVQQVLAHPYQVVIQRAGRPEDEHLAPPGAALMHTGVDGYFIVDAPQTSAALRESQIGRVRSQAIISLGVFHDEGSDYVGIDLAPGTYEATQHLLGIGCRRVAYLIDAGTYSLAESRRNAYVNTLDKAGYAPEFLIAPEQSRTAAYHFMRDHVAAAGAPDGLICVNDDMAMGAHRALWDLGIRVPDDVALIGCDGIPEAEYAHPPLTTIVQPIEEMCRTAWEFLERRIENPLLPPQQKTLTAQLSIRTSSQRQNGSEKDLLATLNSLIQGETV
jgi:DNA-binding LacI/PurR family transcriptional regulator